MISKRVQAHTSFCETCVNDFTEFVEGNDTNNDNNATAAPAKAVTAVADAPSTDVESKKKKNVDMTVSQNDTMDTANLPVSSSSSSSSSSSGQDVESPDDGSDNAIVVRTTRAPTPKADTMEVASVQHAGERECTFF